MDVLPRFLTDQSHYARYSSLDMWSW